MSSGIAADEQIGYSNRCKEMPSDAFLSMQCGFSTITGAGGVHIKHEGSISSMDFSGS